MEKACHLCSKNFRIFPNRSERRSERKWCSRERYGRSRRGIKINVTWGDKISLAKKGKKNNYPSWNKGKTLSLEHRKKISLGLKKVYSGNRTAWNYIGGPQKKYTIQFRKKIRYAIYQRDNYSCQTCSKKEQLVAHHLDNNVKNNDYENLKTLCRSCHARLHINEQFLKKV